MQLRCSIYHNLPQIVPISPRSLSISLHTTEGYGVQTVPNTWLHSLTLHYSHIPKLSKWNVIVKKVERSGAAGEGPTFNLSLLSGDRTRNCNYPITNYSLISQDMWSLHICGFCFHWSGSTQIPWINTEPIIGTPESSRDNQSCALVAFKGFLKSACCFWVLLNGNF